MKFEHYTFGNDPMTLPYGELDKDVDFDDVIKHAGEDPEDEEIWLGQLTADWHGHKKGSFVVGGLTISGYKFHVEIN